MKSDPYKPRSFAARARLRRFRQFAHYAEDCGISGASLLDIGGGTEYWSTHSRHLPAGLIKSIEIVNIEPREESTHTIGGVALYSYTGNALDRASLKQSRYDLVYSNSVIEHVGNLRAQKQMAEVVQALGDFYWIQTPAKSFPIEPHFYVPYFAYLPLSLRAFLHARVNLGWMRRASGWLEARMSCEETRLLTKRELEEIFRGCVVLKERFWGFCKSYIATNMAGKRAAK
jgi:Methyltransferase domain